MKKTNFVKFDFKKCQAAFWQTGGAGLYFRYSSIETDYLKSKDKTLAEVIDKIGHIERETDIDLFSSVIHHIIGQQISTKAQATIWQRMSDCFGEVNADNISCCLTHWKKDESGQHVRKSVPTTKKGSPYLRKTLFQIMDGLIRRSPADDAVYAFMDKKRAQGKPYYVYMTAGANKFLRIYCRRVKEYLATLTDTEET